jgi:hypothetical protein
MMTSMAVVELDSLAMTSAICGRQRVLASLA